MSTSLQLPKMGPRIRLIVSIGLVILGLYFWLNAAIITSAFVALFPAFCNTFFILPVRVVVMFLAYLGSACGWAAIGWLLMVSAWRIWKKSSLPKRYITISSVALILIAICYFTLKYLIIWLA